MTKDLKQIRNIVIFQLHSLVEQLKTDSVITLSIRNIPAISIQHLAKHVSITSAGGHYLDSRHGPLQVDHAERGPQVLSR